MGCVVKNIKSDRWDKTNFIDAAVGKFSCYKRGSGIRCKKVCKNIKYRKTNDCLISIIVTNYSLLSQAPVKKGFLWGYAWFLCTANLPQIFGNAIEPVKDSKKKNIDNNCLIAQLMSVTRLY